MDTVCRNCRHYYKEDSERFGNCIVGEIIRLRECKKWEKREDIELKEKEDKTIKLKAGCEICKDRLSGAGLCNSGCSEYPPVDVKVEEDSVDDEIYIKPQFKNVKKVKIVIQEDKPPLGVTPSFTVYEPRLGEIDQAIERYIDANKEIPIEWVEERNNLLRYFIKK